MYKIKLQGEIDSWGYARYCLSYNLSQAPEGEAIELEVDSLGGDVMEAISISNMLKEHGNITAHIVGFCASAATWLVYGCDKVIINDDCAFLIHKCSSYVDAWGLMNADELDALIEKLKSEKKSNEAIDLIIAQKYVNHSKGKMDIKDALKLMREERWMLPSEALELGLVDEVSEEHVITATNFAARCHVVNAMKSLPDMPEGLWFATAKPSPTEKPTNEAEAEPTTESAAEPATEVVEETTAEAVVEATAEPTVENTERRTMVQRLRDALTEIFGGSVALADPVPAATANDSFPLINAILDVPSLQERGGFLTLNAAQMGAIEQRLVDLVAQVNAATSERDNARTERDNITSERDTAIANLTSAITAIDGISEAIAAIDGVDAKVAAIKDALAKAAGCSTENHAENKGDGHSEDIILDGVNSIVEQYRR